MRLITKPTPFFLFPCCKHGAVYVTSFTLRLYGKHKPNLVLVSPAKFFRDYSQGVCQARCVTDLLKAMTLFLIFGQHPKISYTVIFGTAFWHPYAGICFLQRTVIFLQTKKTPKPCFHRCTGPRNCKHQSGVFKKTTDFRNHRKIYDSVPFI